MSDGSESNPNKIQTEPLKKIGAQDLIKVDYKICGHLRKQGKVNKLFGSRKWNLKFIIVSQGCVYCFNNEHSENPVSAFSLCIYEAVQELTGSSASMPHSFEIVPEEKGKATHVFACETDEKRREWILCLEEVLQQCRQFLGKLSNDSGIDEGVPSKSKGRRNLPPLPNVPGSKAGIGKKYKEAKSEYDLESEDEDEPGDESKMDAYDDVDLPSERAPALPKQAAPKTPMTLPNTGKVQVLPFPPGVDTLRGSRGTISDRPPVPLPTPMPSKAATLPSRLPTSPRGAEGYINNSVFEDFAYIFDSSDRGEVMNLMSTKPEGTFLIRNARSGPGKVLTVMTEVGIKEFQITDKEGKVSLDNKEFFPALSALLTFYNQNNLPKSDYQTKLLRGYRS